MTKVLCADWLEKESPEWDYISTMTEVEGEEK